MSILKKYSIFIFLFLVSIPASYQLLRSGFYEPSDLHHIADIYQMFTAIASGQIPPRLGPDFTYGFSYPLFNFYYVFPFYLGAFWYAITGSLTRSYEFVFILSIFISGPFMYLFLREYFKKIPSIVGAVLYLYTPFRALEIYVRGAMGEALAISLLPLVFYVLSKLIKTGKTKFIGIGAIILAVFIITHNYFWLLSAPFIATFFLQYEIKKYIKLVITGIFGALISMYWWLPALVEQKYVSSSTPFPLIDHFPFIKQLIIPSWGYGASTWGPYDGMSFQIGIVNLLVIVGSVILFLIYKKKLDQKNKFIFIWSIVGLLVTLFLMNVRSFELWKILPIYNFVQFPWRLLFLTTLFSSVLSAFLVENLNLKLSKIIGVLIVIFSILLTITYFKPSQIFYKTDSDYLNRMFALTSVSADYKNWSEDYLLLPRWTEKRPTFLPENKIVGDNNVQIHDINQINKVSWSANSKSDKGGVVTFYAYYFAGWYAKVDGNYVDIQIGKPYGQIQINVPEGLHKVEFFWKETPFRKFADVISLMALVGGIYLICKKEKT